MLQKLIERRQKGNEEGFTLIELMVVVLIIAILLAIAIPSFLGARGKAQDRAAQSNARNALTAEKTYYVDNQAYGSDVALTAANIEPSLTYVNAAIPAKGSKEVFVAVSQTTVAGDTVILGAQSASGKCYYLKDVAGNPGTNWATDTTCIADPSGKTFTGSQPA